MRLRVSPNVEFFERVLLFALPVLICVLLFINLTQRGFNGATRRDDREFRFDSTDSDYSLINEIAGEYNSYFILVFLTASCPSCQELLRDFDRSVLSRYTAGNSAVILVSNEDERIMELLTTERTDILTLGNDVNALFERFNVGFVPTYVAVRPKEKKAFRSMSVLRVLDWIAMKSDAF